MEDNLNSLKRLFQQTPPRQLLFTRNPQKITLLSLKWEKEHPQIVNLAHFTNCCLLEIRKINFNFVKLRKGPLNSPKSPIFTSTPKSSTMPASPIFVFPKYKKKL